MKTIPRSPGRNYLQCQNYGTFKFGLIGSCGFMPDVILMHVNGMMMSQLLTVRNWIDGDDEIFFTMIPEVPPDFIAGPKHPRAHN